MAAKSLIDISRVIAPGEAVYEGDDPLESEVICDIGPDAPCRITSLRNWTTHFLTHVDAPRHFFLEGATLDRIPLERFVCPAIVVDIGEAGVVSAAEIPGRDLHGVAVLFKTPNSRLSTEKFHEDHAYISAEGANELVLRGANLVGIDYLSVDKFGDEDYPAHKALLGAGTLVLEGIDLSGVAAGDYELSALPLRIGSADGSPVRAVLTSE